MKKLFLAVAILCTTLVLAQEQASGIFVNGEGSVKVVPDEVILQVNIQEEGKSAQAVKQSTDKVMNEVLKYLKSEKIPQKNIQTEYVRLGKNVQTSKYGNVPNAVNFYANQSISILLTDVSKYDEITQGLLELGINGINSVQFRSSEIEMYEADARLKAIKNAKEKAEAYAKALEVKVGAPILISESSSNNFAQPQVYRMMEMKQSSASNNQTLAVGEMEVTAQIQINFSILN
ncbi:SIMPL domain-containing protein [Mesonia sp.]|uniref:SIMPL domain-containing protein n=1 Tax=Mesonia sp. TaxID=1960830 RepID=UPI00176800CB|nr:SIMPL domain-containing protein [Mesonia sp.]HIB37338.1 DUF541 domain-containing protein [Mesonia sp.]